MEEVLHFPLFREKGKFLGRLASLLSYGQFDLRGIIEVLGVSVLGRSCEKSLGLIPQFGPQWLKSFVIIN